jgi:hypothetical protein
MLLCRNRRNVSLSTTSSRGSSNTFHACAGSKRCAGLRHALLEQAEGQTAVGATKVIDRLFTILIVGAGVALVCIPIAVECQSVEAVRIAAGSALALFAAAQIVKLIGLAEAMSSG